MVTICHSLLVVLASRKVEDATKRAWLLEELVGHSPEVGVVKFVVKVSLR
jgi:hypothetical protein